MCQFLSTSKYDWYYMFSLISVQIKQYFYSENGRFRTFKYYLTIIFKYYFIYAENWIN